MKWLGKNQRGDTIVEVLLAITVLSIVLTISYSLASRAFRTLQISKDQIQAVLILQEQGEGYRAIRDELSFSDFRTAVEAPGAQTRVVTQNSGTDLLWHIEAASGPYPPYPLYQVASEVLFSDGDGDGADDTATITTTIQWDRLGGGTDRQTLVTKLRDLKVSAIPPSSPPPPPPCDPAQVRLQSNSFAGAGTNVGDPAADGGAARRFTGGDSGVQQATRVFNPVCIYANLAPTGKVVNAGGGDGTVNLRVRVNENGNITENTVTFSGSTYRTPSFPRAFSALVNITIEPQGLENGEQFYLDFMDVSQ